MTTKPERLTRRKAAAYLGVAEQTLALWAHNGRYKLPYIKCGRKVLYNLADLDKFVASRTITHAGELSIA